MRHSITTPGGTIYATVWKEDGLLKIAMPRYPDVTILMDEKAIPQLRSILETLDEAVESVTIDQGCFERGCACHDPRVDHDGVQVRGSR